MKRFFRNMGTNFCVAGELLTFLWERRAFWLIPLVIILLFFGLLIIFASSSGIGPFIYTLF